MPFYLGEGTDFIPSFNLTNADGLALKQKISAGSTQFSFSDLGSFSTTGDNLADFSSRGPSRVTYDIKPEVTAPGVSVLSTVPGFVHSPDNPTDYKYAYERMSGTSMATPEVAGIAALLLQAHPYLQPEDVKSILMNTADPLSKTYSVFEEGAGRVDPEKAIESTMEIKVKENTPTIINGREKQIKEDTGALSFGNETFTGKDITDSRSISFKNYGKNAKTFDVSVTYQTDARGSKDAQKNGVTVDMVKTIKVPGNSEVTKKVTLTIPKTADKGIYEGYIVYTNHDNPSETYRVPFGVHFVEEGFQDFSLDRLTMTSDRNNLTNPFFNPYNYGSFTLKSHMRYIDAVVEDVSTGKDVGYLGTLDGTQFDEGVPYRFNAFMGFYYPFTNDPNNPISSHEVLAPEGHYKLKLIGYDDAGRSYTATQDVFIDNTMPNKFDVQVEGEKAGNPFVEYKPGQQTVPVTASIQDKMINTMKAAGFNMDQSKNGVWYYYNSPWPGGQLTLDAKGNGQDEIAMSPSSQELNVRFEGIDAAGNSYGRKQYFFVQNDTPYVYGQPNTATRLNQVNAHIGDTVTITLTANNVNKVKQAAYSFSTYTEDTNIVGISLNPKAKKLGGKLDVKTTNSNDKVNTNVNVAFDGTSRGIRRYSNGRCNPSNTRYEGYCTCLKF